MEKIFFGGDYNPEQWPEETWQDDMSMLKDAGVDILTVNVFSWAKLQRSEHRYDFKQLDRIMKLAKESGMKVCLATSTAAHPAWMAKRHPDVLQVDFEGRKRKFGMRHNSCPSSPTYRKYSARLAKKLARRYKDFENIAAWHVSNEYSADCYCARCEKRFRLWLKEKYKTLDKLNHAWNTSFWGHTFYRWNEIVVPDKRSEQYSYAGTCFQGISLDYRRFQSDAVLECYRREYDAVKKYMPETPVTTNLMAYHFQLDQKKWAKYMDMVSWDNYPAYDSPEWSIAMWHDLMRGLKGGHSFWLMEQTPGITNWADYPVLKRPGEMRELSYQAVAHGADTVMFFQMKRNRGACETFHGAIIDHAVSPETRVYREVKKLGEELRDIKAVTLGARTNSRVAILFDWDNWWATTFCTGFSKDFDYPKEIQRAYRAFYELHIPVDMIGLEDDLEKYDLVVAPVLYMVNGKYDDRIRRFVKNGGAFVSGFMTGYVDENDLITMGGYPGKLRDILGIWVEETDAVPKGRENSFRWNEEEYSAKLLCDIIHTEGATALATYEREFYAGSPAVTENAFGDGKAYYIGTASSPEFYRAFLGKIARDQNIVALGDAPCDVELTIRSKGSNSYIFALNHSTDEKTVKIWSASTDILTGEKFEAQSAITLGNMGVRILNIEN